jgi:hypothetical protein
MCFLVYILFYLFWKAMVVGFELGAYILSHSTSPFFDGFFRDRDLDKLFP